MFYLSKKGKLGNKLMSLRKVFPKNYNFFPKTWILRTDKNEFKKELLVKFYLFY